MELKGEDYTQLEFIVPFDSVGKFKNFTNTDFSNYKRKSRITADTALKLSKFYEKFCLGLQNDFDIEERKLNKQNDLNEIKQYKNENVS